MAVCHASLPVPVSVCQSTVILLLLLLLLVLPVVGSARSFMCVCVPTALPTTTTLPVLPPFY